MPKLDGTHLPGRLAARLADLRAGEDVAARDIKALLSDAQISAMEAAWDEQQNLRKSKRARTKEEERALGWKTKREIHIEAYERAIKEAKDGVLDELDRLQMKATKRQMRIYMDKVDKELKDGYDLQTAQVRANNDLTRTALQRLDGQVVGHINQRDKEVWEIEEQIKQRARSAMTPEELEQLELLEEHEKAMRDKAKKLGR